MKRLIEEYGQVILAFLAIVALVFIINPLGSMVGDGIKGNVNSMVNGINGNIPQGGGGSGPSYTYDVISTSESGKQLDHYTVTYGVGTSNLIKPKTIEGYIAPQSQMVSWDAETKTIEFNYDLVDYSLSVDLNGGTSASGISIPSNYTVESDAITLPSDITKGDETFIGYSGSGLTSINKNVTIPTGSTGNRSYIANYKRAEYVTIRFDSRGGEMIESQQILKGGTLNELPTVTKTGYEFLGWYNGNTKVNASDMFDADTQLIAKWKAKHLSRNIIYRSASGVDLKRSTIEYDFGQRVTVKGLDFAGYDKPADHVFTADMNTNDIVIKYTPISYKITYNLNGGGFVNQSGISSYTIESNDITIPEATRVGHTFTGWSDNKGSALTRNYVIKKGMTGDITLTANYNVNAYRLTFNANGGSCYESYRNLSYGQYFTNLPTPTREGYEFAGWYTQLNGETLIDQNHKMGAKDMTVYAKWISYQLVDGPTVNAKLKEIDNVYSIKSIEFVDTIMPAYNVTEITGLGNTSESVVKGWYTIDDFDSMAKVYISSQKSGQKILANANSSKMFNGNISYNSYYLETVQLIDVEKLDVSNATNLEFMFYSAGYNSTVFNIKGLNAWDVSRVENMRFFFTESGFNAEVWNIGVLSDWDVSSVADMSSMFNNAGRNSTVWNIGDLSNWNVSNVIKMGMMFGIAGYKAESWNIGDLSNWNVSNVTDMHGMFYYAGCYANDWSIGDISNWDVKNVTNMNSMFNYAGYKASTWSIGDLSNWDVSNVTNMMQLFAYSGIYSQIWSVGDLSNWDVSNVTDMHAMFRYTGGKSTNWNIGNLKNWKTEKVKDMQHMFDSAGEYSETFNLDLSLWNVSNVTNMRYMFKNTGRNSQNWNIGDLSNWNVGSVSIMSGMFNNAGKKAEHWDIGDLSSWDVKNVIDMSEMFSSAGYSSKEWNVGNLNSWNVSKVTNMSSMFCYAGEISSVWNIGNIGQWNVSNVTDMHNMFMWVGSNATLWDIGDLSNWDVSKVTNMGQMFYYTAIKTTTWNIGNLSQWDVSNVTNMNRMFYNAGLRAQFSLDLSNWNVNKVINHTEFNFSVENKVIPPNWIN